MRCPAITTLSVPGCCIGVCDACRFTGRSGRRSGGGIGGRRCGGHRSGLGRPGRLGFDERRVHLCGVVISQFLGDDVGIGEHGDEDTEAGDQEDTEARQRGSSQQAAGRQSRQGRVCRRGRQGRQKDRQNRCRHLVGHKARRSARGQGAGRSGREPDLNRDRCRREHDRSPAGQTPAETPAEPAPTETPTETATVEPKAPEPTPAVEEQTTSTSAKKMRSAQAQETSTAKPEASLRGTDVAGARGRDSREDRSSRKSRETSRRDGTDPVVSTTPAVLSVATPQAVTPRTGESKAKPSLGAAVKAVATGVQKLVTSVLGALGFNPTAASAPTAPTGIGALVVGLLGWGSRRESEQAVALASASSRSPRR